MGAIHYDCKIRPRALPPCPPGVTAPTWSEIAKGADKLAGEIVRISGPLVLGPSYFTTLAECDLSTCCNRVGSSIGIGGTPRTLELAGLGCAGDDSRLCCNAPAYGQRVVAKGRLQFEIPRDFPDRFKLLDAEVCAASD